MQVVYLVSTGCYRFPSDISVCGYDFNTNRGIHYFETILVFPTVRLNVDGAHESRGWFRVADLV
jgi:hypothetical protein